MHSLPARFEVLEQLAAGPGLRMLRARDTLLLREVFLKCAAPDPRAGAPDAATLERRLREARALARVAHPSVQRLIDVVELPTGPLLVLEPVAGESLTARLAREGRLAPEEAIVLGTALAEALEAIHAAGLLHRGVHPDAVVLGEGGRVTLTGFHLAKPASTEPHAAPSSLVLQPGSLGKGIGRHPAPEQLLSGQDSPRADLFGLGWTLYESLAGRSPYVGADPKAWSEPEDLHELAPAAPPALVRLLSLCLARSPAERPPDATTVRHALEKLGGTRGTTHATAAPTGRSGHRRWLWTGVALAAAAAQVLLLLGGPFRASAEGRGVWHESGAPERATAAARQAQALQPRYARSRALLIGIGGYGAGFQPLANAERDIDLVRGSLQREAEAGWEFTTLLGSQATRAEIVDAFHTLCSRSGPDDRALIYFAGHGRRHQNAEGIGWMIPADATEKPSSWIPFNEFDQIFREDPGPKHILVAMDCCYGGRLIDMLPTRSAGETRYAERYLTRKAHVVITSGRGDEQVTDGPRGQSSPFARAFTDTLAEPGPPLTASELYAQIQRLFGTWDLAQVPLLGRGRGSTQDGGDFVFFREAR